MICVHAENGQVIQVLVEEAVAAGRVAPKYHSLTRPSSMEGEATHRAIKIAELAETPLYVVHLSAREALGAVAEARDAGLPVHAETCPHYLFLTQEAYDRPEFEGAKYVMTPPLRDASINRPCGVGSAPMIYRWSRPTTVRFVSTSSRSA